MQKYALGLIIERATECINQGQSIPVIQRFQDVVTTTLASINDAEISQAFENQYKSAYQNLTYGSWSTPMNLLEAQAAGFAIQKLSQQYDQLQPLCTAAEMCEKILCDCEAIDPMFGLTDDEKEDLEFQSTWGEYEEWEE